MALLLEGVEIGRCHITLFICVVHGKVLLFTLIKWCMIINSFLFIFFFTNDVLLVSEGKNSHVQIVMGALHRFYEASS